MTAQSRFTTGFIKAAAQAGFLDTQASLLLKQGIDASTILKLMKSRPANLAGGTLGALGGGYEANQEFGGNLGMTAAGAIGGGIIGRPGMWAKMHELASAAKTPQGLPVPYAEAATDQLMQLLKIKALPVAGLAGLSYGPQILKDIQSTTGNAAHATGALSNASPEIAKNLVDTSKGLAGSAGGMKDMMANTQKYTEQMAQTMNTNIPKITDAANNLSDSLSRVTNTAGDITAGIAKAPGKIYDTMSDGKGGLSTTGKVTAGAGGGLLLAYLLNKMTQRDKKPKTLQISY